VDYLRELRGCPRAWGAVGVRADDSARRRMAIRTYGPCNVATRSFFPVWDWSRARCFDEIQAAGLRLPPDYRLFACTLDGLRYTFIRGLHAGGYRDDVERIRQWFPLIEAELTRYEVQSAEPTP
jgi:hypothetical protein